jgi:hypothetical protein
LPPGRLATLGATTNFRDATLTMIRRALVAVWLTGLSGLAVMAQQPPSGSDQFLPLDQLPPGQELPAAPFLIGAYAFVWIAAMFYLWTIWRRVGKLGDEMKTLERRSARGDGAR